MLSVASDSWGRADHSWTNQKFHWCNFEMLYGFWIFINIKDLPVEDWAQRCRLWDNQTPLSISCVIFFCTCLFYYCDATLLFSSPWFTIYVIKWCSNNSCINLFFKHKQITISIKNIYRDHLVSKWFVDNCDLNFAWSPGSNQIMVKENLLKDIQKLAQEEGQLEEKRWLKKEAVITYLDLM